MRPADVLLLRLTERLVRLTPKLWLGYLEFPALYLDGCLLPGLWKMDLTQI